MPAPASFSGPSVQSTSYPNSTSFVRPYPVGNHSTMPYSNNSRPSYPMNYNGFSDDMTETYKLHDMPSPQYQLQGQEPHLPSVQYSSPEVSRPWPSMASARQLQQNFTMEPDGSSSFMSSFPLPSTTLSTNTTVAPSQPTHFPAMGVLKGSLPNCELNNRILPAPGSKLGPINKNYRGMSTSQGETVDAGIPQSLSYRTGAWTADLSGNDGNHHSVGSSTSSTISNPEDPGSNSSSSPQMSQKSTAFGYRPGQQDRESNYGSTYNSSATALVDRQVGLDNNGLNGDLSNDHILPTSDSSSNQYTYNLGSSTKYPEGTLVNGQSYTRLQEPQNSQSYDNLNHLGNTATYHPHRTSISNTRHH